MSRTVILSFLLAISAAIAPHCQSQTGRTRNLYSITSSGSHERPLWVIPEVKFQETCYWDTRNLKEPPLSVMAAITAARSFLSSRGEPDQLPLSSVQLRRPINAVAGESLYFYVIVFDDSGQAECEKKFVHVVVLLDGSVLAPDAPAVFNTRRKP